MVSSFNSVAGFVISVLSVMEEKSQEKDW